MAIKTPGKIFGNFFILFESVSPLFTSSPSLFNIFLKAGFFVCFSRIDIERERDNPAESIPNKFFVKTIFSRNET